MANTLKFGDGKWATGEGTALAFNDENENFKPLPFTFTRNSTATVVNESGLIEEVGNDVPRIDFNDNTKGALLLEPSRTNLLLNSVSLESSWLASGTNAPNLTASQFISPDGTQNASRLQFPSTGTTSIFQQLFSHTNGQQYTISAYVKSNSSSNQQFKLYGDYGTPSGISSVLTATSEWQRFTFTYTATGTGSRSGGFYYIQNTTSDLQVFGIQAEAGSYATSYIPTSGSAVTRVVDSCSQENLLTDIIDASYPFTFYVDGTYDGQLSTLLSFLNKDASQQFFLIYINNNEVLLSARSNGTIERIESGINLIKGQKYKIAVTMNSATSGKICVNGNSVTVKNNFSSQIQNSNITDLLIGQERIVSDGGIRSSVSGVKLYNEALSDSELITLTT